MAVMDEFREEREALKNGTPKEKLNYFWYYYKWHVIITIAVVAFLASLIYTMVTQKETAFYGVFINCIEQEGAPAYVQSFADTVGIDTEEYDVIADSSLYINVDDMNETTTTSNQKLMTYIAAGEIDVMVSDVATIEQYTGNETLADLREILTPEQIAEYEPYFYYADLNGEPVPMGIYVDSCEAFKEAYAFFREPLVLSVVTNTGRPETTIAFIDYLFNN